MKMYRHSILIACLVLLLPSCKNKEEGKAKEMVVQTSKAITVSDKKGKEFSFIAQPFRTSELSFRVGGPIDRLDVYAGNHYKRGNIIAEIDPRDFHIRRERAEAVYNQAEAEYLRVQNLYEKNNLSASAYEKAKAEYTSAKAAFHIAANELEDTRLVAPFNGYVGEVFIEKFQDVKATQKVLTLIDIDQLKIEVYITQEMAYAAQSLDTIEVRFDDQPEHIYKAKVVEVSKGTTRNNLSYLLTALLPNEDGKLLAGMSGKVCLNISTTSDSKNVSIPQTALCHRPSIGDYVWVVQPETKQVEQRKVMNCGLLPDGYVEVSGMKSDEIVAVSGLRFLSPGMKVSTSEKI